MRRGRGTGRFWADGACEAASVCVGEAASLAAMLARLRFSEPLAPLDVSLGVSWTAGVAGAASSRARARVERRGSDMADVSVLSMIVMDGGNMGEIMIMAGAPSARHHFLFRLSATRTINPLS
jgi:hypothetical protein